MHPPNFHKDEEARQRCYGCSHPEMLESSPEDIERAKALIADGYRSTSNKYQMVARALVPRAEQAITFAADVPEWLRKATLDFYERWTEWGMRGNYERIEHLELPLGVFRAFKKLGGRMA